MPFLFFFRPAGFKNIYNVKDDSHEGNNIASDPQYAEVIAELRKSAPTEFADSESKLNARRDLVIEGETLCWEKGKGIYVAHKKIALYRRRVEAKAIEERNIIRPASGVTAFPLPRNVSPAFSNSTTPTKGH
ncbi:hypothetical protein [Roseiconus lacunae]|uniref:hypothetical protein n=1 Tax=Roseiconus lacunae TaxID=2605694 RepID=UPI0013571FB3|nr:hypothetical protein [Roseiconus lacunae]